MESSVTLRNAIQAAFDVPGLTRLMIDLSETTFLDSAGIHVLVTSRQQADKNGIHLRVVNPSDVARRVLAIAGVLEFLNAER
jgi:anti-sigma B factor antagonist